MHFSKSSISYLLISIVLASVGAFADAAGVETLWNHHAPSGHFASSPSVGDINGDGILELVVATTGGSIIALDGDARPFWRQDVEGTVTVSPTLADVCGGCGTGSPHCG